MKTVNWTIVILRYIASIAFALYFALYKPDMALWLRGTFVVLLLVPTVADMVRMYKFWKQNIKQH
ncbi:MAG: hypothetical protein P4L41_10515 [Flavipsychrobacter sp.]|nr:hypothetical protein [Flavipsychrobacter sp.]